MFLRYQPIVKICTIVSFNLEVLNSYILYYLNLLQDCGPSRPGSTHLYL